MSKKNCLLFSKYIMQKTPELYDIRISKKKNIEFFSKQKNISRIWEFWRYMEWVNIGNEISKDNKFMRVCMILQNDLWNWLLLVAPITTKYHKRMDKYYIKVENYKKYWLKECRIITNQVKLIDQKRLVEKTWSYNSHITLRNIVLENYINIIKKSPSKK